jgi:hypothetical protein
MKFPYGMSDFYQLITEGYFYVDRTDRIPIIEETNDKDLTASDETTAALRQLVRPMIVGRFLHEVMHWPSEELESIRKRNWSDLQ